MPHGRPALHCAAPPVTHTTPPPLPLHYHRYVFKRPRIEAVAADISSQCRLLADLVDVELQEELSAAHAARGSLTQVSSMASGRTVAQHVAACLGGS